MEYRCLEYINEGARPPDMQVGSLFACIPPAGIRHWRKSFMKLVRAFIPQRYIFINFLLMFTVKRHFMSQMKYISLFIVYKCPYLGLPSVTPKGRGISSFQNISQQPIDHRYSVCQLDDCRANRSLSNLYTSILKTTLYSCKKK